MQFYPRWGEEQWKNSLMSMSYLGSIHEHFCIDTGDPNNRNRAEIFRRCVSIGNAVDEFVNLIYLVNR